MTAELMFRPSPSSGGWRWAGAVVVGTRHEREAREGQDAGSVSGYPGRSGPTLIAVISDGAGSAKFGAFGARIVTNVVQRCVRTYLKDGGTVSAINQSHASHWLSVIHSRIESAANATENKFADFAATMTLAVISSECACVIQIGDSSCVVRVDGHWTVPIWPMKGEYANETEFVTSCSGSDIAFVLVRGQVEAFALFTDGLEHLLLDFREKRAFGPFFDAALQKLEAVEGLSRARNLSNDLNCFLASDRINSHTDDDKTLVIACWQP